MVVRNLLVIAWIFLLSRGSNSASTHPPVHVSLDIVGVADGQAKVNNSSTLLEEALELHMRGYFVAAEELYKSLLQASFVYLSKHNASRDDNTSYKVIKCERCSICTWGSTIQPRRGKGCLLEASYLS